VARDWLIAQVAERFHVLPTVARDDLNRDPEQLSLQCLPLLGYAEAYRAWKRGKKAELKSWEGSHFMDLVKENDFDGAEAELSGGTGTEGA
jgi:hypothetical protein